MRYLVILAFLLVGCGASHTTSGPQGEPGVPGQDGSDGQDAVVHSSIEMSTVNDCYTVVEDELYVQNEGSKMDVYNNPYCDHSPYPFIAYCDNVYTQEVCWVDNRQLTIEGAYNEMILHVLEF